ncbi:MAG: carbohydrate kinase [Chloroflexi bacterium]|nr:carbohydrate kinase [Chloroflexota bacterium]
MPYDVDIVVIGHFAKDRLVHRYTAEDVAGGDEEIASGGSVYYGALALQRLGLSVAVVTRLHQADFPRLDELKNEGILVFAQPAEQTSGIENVYYTADMDRRLCKPLGFAGPFAIEDVPPLQTRIVLLGPIMAGEIDLPFIKALSGRGRIALDAQGFVRVREGDDLVLRDWPEKREGFPYVDFLKVDGAEAEALTGKTDLREAARELAGYGAGEIILTHATGVLVYAERAYYEAPFTPRALKGRTGRGDTCFASYLARRLMSSPAESCQFAALVTSRKMEAPGPLRGWDEAVL